MPPATASGVAMGTSAPDFSLANPATGHPVSRDECRGDKGLLVMFLCNHCPYVKHLEDALLRLCRQYADSGIGMVGISANDPVGYPEDHPERMKERALEKNYPFAYLFDQSQQTARQWGAVCTPEFFLYDADLKCCYHGRFDASSPGNHLPVTGADLKAALDALLAAETPLAVQHPSMGCSIKWRA